MRAPGAGGKSLAWRLAGQTAASMTKVMICGGHVITGSDPPKRHEEGLYKGIARLVCLESGPEMLRRLLHTAEFGSAETGRHFERMSRYCALVARRLGLGKERCELIRAASLLHDIGKIGVPDTILLKPGPLSAQERSIVEQHPEIGHRMLTGSGSEPLELAATIALTHHERCGGGGYPRGLVGEAIPLEGRIAGVADVFDALTSERAYRRAFSLGEALEMMASGRATHFDPEILDLFLASLPEVLAIEHACGTGEVADLCTAPAEAGAGPSWRRVRVTAA